MLNDCADEQRRFVVVCAALGRWQTCLLVLVIRTSSVIDKERGLTESKVSVNSWKVRAVRYFANI